MDSIIIKKGIGGEGSAYFNEVKIGDLRNQHSTLDLRVDGFELIENLNFNSIPEEIEDLDIDINISKKYKTYPFYIDFVFIWREKEEFSEIDLHIIPDIDNWILTISPKVFVDYFFEEIEKVRGFNLEKVTDSGREGIAFYLNLKMSVNHDFSIGENLENIFEICEHITTQAITKHKQFSINTFFSFPEEYKTACEQYLLYFATFLKDLGIEAKTDLKNQENGVLFKVFPKDKEAALTQIKEALDVYLALPTQQNLEIVTNDYQDISVQQLISNVYHLKGQLMLAQSTLQMKDATITALELSNYQLKQIVDKQEVKTENEEQILGDIVIVKEYDGNGLKVNLPELFRLLKRKIWGG